jgi:predicted ester cyclase
MSIEENKQLVLRWREELWDKRNVNVLDELCAPDYVGHIAGTPGPVRGREAFKQLIAAYLAALDIRVTPEFLIAEGDMVAVRDTNWVKSTGEVRGMPPTGKEGTLTSTDIYRIAGGMVVEQWFEADLTGFLQQLGVYSTPGQAGS